MISTSSENGNVPVTVFHLKGDLTAEEPLTSNVSEAYDSGMRYALLDLSKVKYISSGGLRAIHGIFTLLRGDTPEESDEQIKKGILKGTYSSPYLKLFKPSKNAKKTLSISGYDMFLEIHTNYKSAIKSFG